MDVPCKDCTERHLHCHGECDKYKAFVEWNEERLAKKREAVNMRNFHIERKMRNVERKRRRTAPPTKA